MMTPGPALDLVNGFPAAVFAMSHGPAFDLAIGLAAAVSIVHYHRRVDDYTRSRDKGRYDPTIGWVVNAEVSHLVWQFQQTDGADDLLAPVEQQIIPA
jgi:hypothetical protein